MFISYRRSDTRADAGRLYDRLATRFGDDRVFMDIDDIRAGQKFVDVLNDTLAACDLLIVMIGPSWATTQDEHGRQRLSNLDDFVRLEVLTALRRGIKIFPVLVNHARMPPRELLPEDLRGFADYQAIEVSDTRFHQDVDTLIAVLETAVSPAGVARRQRPTAAIAVLVGAGLLALAWGLYSGVRSERSEGIMAVLGADTPVVAEPSRADSSTQPRSLRAAGATLSAAEVTAMLVRNDFFDAGWFPTGAGTDSAYEVSVMGGQTVVIDRGTGLMWQLAGSGSPTPFASAVGQISTMNAGAYAGFSDWRLPTLEEAASLLTPTKPEGGAHIAPHFPASGAPMVWTSDRIAEDRHWVVFFYDGISRPEPADYNAWVRAVRSLD